MDITKYLKSLIKKAKIILTFFEKGFHEEINVLRLTEKDKAIFLRDMVSLTPNERKNLITGMKESINTSH